MELSGKFKGFRECHVKPDWLNLFTGIYSHAGCIRDYNVTKKEWVLDGATVIYGSATELRAALDFGFF